MGDLANNVFANIISNAITYLLSLVLLTFLGTFVAKAVSARANLLHTDTVVKLLVSASCNVFAYFLFAYVFALVYKQSGWEMGSGATISVIVAGITSPLVSFISFILLSPMDWRQAAIVGVLSLFFTYGYMAVMLAIYQIVFRFMEKFPGV